MLAFIHSMSLHGILEHWQILLHLPTSRRTVYHLSTLLLEFHTLFTSLNWLNNEGQNSLYTCKTMRRLWCFAISRMRFTLLCSSIVLRELTPYCLRLAPRFHSPGSSCWYLQAGTCRQSGLRWLYASWVLRRGMHLNVKLAICSIEIWL